MDNGINDHHRAHNHQLTLASKSQRKFHDGKLRSIGTIRVSKSPPRKILKAMELSSCFVKS